jgi:hypothetical protein
VVIEGLEVARHPAPQQRPPQQLVGKARALGQHRPMQIGTEDVVAHGPLGAVAPVVAAPGRRRAQRLNPRAELGQAAVVLIAHEPSVRRGIDVLVADEPGGRSGGTHVEHPGTRYPNAVLSEEFVAEQLVGPADRQHHDAVIGHRA